MVNSWSNQVTAIGSPATGPLVIGSARIRESRVFYLQEQPEFFAHYHVAARRDSLWIATQGEIAKYAFERDNCIVHLTGTNPGTLHLETTLDPVRFDVPLSVCLTAACNEIDLLLVDDAICPLSERR